MIAERKPTLDPFTIKVTELQAGGVSDITIARTMGLPNLEALKNRLQIGHQSLGVSTCIEAARRLAAMDILDTHKLAQGHSLTPFKRLSPFDEIMLRNALGLETPAIRENRPKAEPLPLVKITKRLGATNATQVAMLYLEYDNLNSKPRAKTAKERATPKEIDSTAITIIQLRGRGYTKFEIAQITDSDPDKVSRILRKVLRSNKKNDDSNRAVLTTVKFLMDEKKLKKDEFSDNRDLSRFSRVSIEEKEVLENLIDPDKTDDTPDKETRQILKNLRLKFGVSNASNVHLALVYYTYKLNLPVPIDQSTNSALVSTYGLVNFSELTPYQIGLLEALVCHDPVNHPSYFEKIMHYFTRADPKNIEKSLNLIRLKISGAFKASTPSAPRPKQELPQPVALSEELAAFTGSDAEISKLTSFVYSRMDGTLRKFHPEDRMQLAKDIVNSSIVKAIEKSNSVRNPRAFIYDLTLRGIRKEAVRVDRLSFMFGNDLPIIYDNPPHVSHFADQAVDEDEIQTHPGKIIEIDELAELYLEYRKKVQNLTRAS